jgi:glycosyltransferase involved in cell wall biosynthesis
MRLTVDGIVFQQRGIGGISRVFDEILPRMCSLDPGLSVRLLANPPLRRALPVHPNIHRVTAPPIDYLLRPGRVWGAARPRARALASRIRLGRGSGAIWQSTYYTTSLGWKGAKVLLVYDMIYELFPSLFRHSWDDHFRDQKRRCVFEADAVVCISHATKTDLLRFYDLPEARVRVVHVGVSDVFLGRRPGTSPTAERNTTPRPFVLFVGGRALYKNFDFLLSGYAAWKGNRDVDLVVVGPPWTRTEAGRLLELGIAQKVRLLKSVSDTELAVLYGRAEAFVHPSLREGFGIPLLEAMACGCPVVASRIPSTIEVASDRALLFDPFSVEELAGGLEAAVTQGRGTERVSGGLERARSFTWDATAQGMLNIYRGLV